MLRTLNQTPQLRFLLDAMPSLVAFVDKNYRYHFCNKAYSIWFQVPPEKAIGRTMSEIIGEEAFKSVRHYVDRALAGETVEWEGWLKYDSGQRYVKVHYSPFRNLEGEIIGISGMVHDITDKKRVEEKLRESEERFLQMAENLTDRVLHIMDMNPLRISYISPSYERLYGRTVESIYENPLSYLEAVHPDDRKVLDDSVQRQRNGEITDITYRILKPNGEIRWIHDRTMPFFDSEKNIVRAAGMAEDITVRKTAQIEFEKNVDQSPAILWITDKDGQCTYLSKQWTKFTGQAPEEALGFGWVNAVHPEDRANAERKFRQSSEQGTVFYTEFRLQSAEGNYRWVIDAANPRFDSKGNFQGMAGTVFDIHERRLIHNELQAAKEKAEEANRSKTAFLANMSHEIRTPMTAVLGFTEILRNPGLSDAERQDALSRIERSGRALLRVIDDVLDISKVEAGKITLEKVRFAPIEIVTEVVGLLRLQAEQKGIGLNLKVAPDLPESVCTDPNRLRQILTNLVGNAVKFTSSGQVLIEVDCDKKDGKEFLVFVVRDTGIGISAEDQKKLFHPFGQADDSITRRYGGTGLGLVLSKRLAEKLGGDLVLHESTVGKGSAFVVRVEAGPFKSAYLREPESFATKAPKLNGKDLSGANVLVVDDVADNQILMRKYLEKAGAHVDTAGDGEEAINKALDKGYDVILMDIQMPGVDGIQATKKLRSMGYEKPILALTAHAMKEEAQRSIEAGCNEHLTKPITREILVKNVKSYIAPPSLPI